jgi:hypothetical protein
MADQVLYQGDKSEVVPATPSSRYQGSEHLVHYIVANFTNTSELRFCALLTNDALEVRLERVATG